MRYLSVCSGIEAATVAWHPLGWKAAAYSEIEKFPSQVLAHHYPDVPNVGDMTKFKEWTNVSNVDVLVGGTPCQSFSVAGLRKGLDDPRGNLMLTYLAIATKFRPKWLVWENVPGVLSSNGGLDFASLLRGMGECGYGFAYRILDAQYFGVAQRRKRVFVVGCFGDWRAAAAVLFERHSLCGYPAPSREKRESIAASIGDGTQVSHLIGGQDCGHLSSEICGTIVTREGTVSDTSHMLMQPIPIDSMNHIGRGDNHSMGDFVPGAPCYTLTKGHSHAVAQPLPFDTTQITSPQNRSNPKAGDPCHPLVAGGDAPAIVQPIALAKNTIGRKPENGGNGDGFTEGGPMYTLNATGVHAVAQPICLMDQGGSVMNIEHDITGTLRRETHGHEPIVMQPISFSGQMSNPQTDVGMTQTLQAKNPMAVCLGGQHPNASIGIDQSPTLTNAMGAGGGHIPITNAMAIRRLTPVECERLQGFPDNYTNIKDKCPDGPRYKALGNSMAVPVMAWIGKRIQEVENL